MCVRGIWGRVPLRARLTLAFAAVMALLLAALGAYVVIRQGAAVDRSVDAGLRSRVADVRAQVRSVRRTGRGDGRGSLSGLSLHDAQVLDARTGAVLGGSSATEDGLAVLAPARVRLVGRRARFFDLPESDAFDGVHRVLAAPLRLAGRDVVVAVVASLEARDEARDSLRSVLVAGSVLALLLASAGGYGVAAAALRPVEAMRARAAGIGAGNGEERLPVPLAHDEVRALGETLNAMLDRLHGALDRERRFVADAGHELRTPLAILKVELDIALRSGHTVDELRATLRSASEETDRLAQLAEDLLVLARAGDGRLPVRIEPLDARSVLERVRDRFAARAAGVDRALEVDAPAGLRMRADPLRLDQALGNVVDNALRHGAGRIRLVARPAGDGVRLGVSDDGPGFPDDFAPRAFERFSRADSARGRGGAGLGLAIVATVAEAHGGDAAIGPEGPGAVVWLHLPGPG